MAARLATVENFFPEADFAELERGLREIPARGTSLSGKAVRRSPRGSMLGIVAVLTVGFGITVPISSLPPSHLGAGTAIAQGLGDRNHASVPEAQSGRTIASEPVRGYARGFTTGSKSLDPVVTGSIGRPEHPSVPSRFVQAALNSGLGIFGPPIRR